MQEEVSQAVMSAKVLKVVWILCSVAVLVVTLVRYAPGPASDIGVFLVYGMLFLAFPISLLVAGLFALMALLQEQLKVPLLDLIGSNYVGFFVMWLAFFVAGYLQWFVLLPRLWRRWKGWYARRATPHA
jgi:hypothetical protein